MGIKNPRYVKWWVEHGFGTREVRRIEGECVVCGRTITITHDDGYGFECDCGQIYNLGGQELRPREEWEEPMEEDDY